MKSSHGPLRVGIGGTCTDYKKTGRQSARRSMSTRLSRSRQTPGIFYVDIWR